MVLLRPDEVSSCLPPSSPGNVCNTDDVRHRLPYWLRCGKDRSHHLTPTDYFRQTAGTGVGSAPTSTLYMSGPPGRPGFREYSHYRYINGGLGH